MGQSKPSPKANKIVRVRSKTYGEHERAARGTFKEAVLNEAFKESNKQLVQGNAAAQIIRNALLPLIGDFHTGLFWQRLVALFKRQYKLNGEFDVRGLMNFHINNKHSFYSLINLQYGSRFGKEEPGLAMKISVQDVRFPSPRVDCFQLSFMAVYPDFKRNTFTSDMVQLPVMSLYEPCHDYDLIFDLPEEAESYLICAKIEGGTEGKMNGGMYCKSMMVLEAARISR